jgi:hypothetical protein
VDQKRIWSAQVTGLERVGKESRTVDAGAAGGGMMKTEEGEDQEGGKEEGKKKNVEKEETKEEPKNETKKKMKKRKRKEICITEEELEEADQEIRKEAEGAIGTRTQREMMRGIWERAMAECRIEQPYDFSVPVFRKFAGWMLATKSCDFKDIAPWTGILNDVREEEFSDGSRPWKGNRRIKKIVEGYAVAVRKRREKKKKEEGRETEEEGGRIAIPAFQVGNKLQTHRQELQLSHRLALLGRGNGRGSRERDKRKWDKQRRKKNRGDRGAANADAVRGEGVVARGDRGAGRGNQI